MPYITPEDRDTIDYWLIEVSRSVLTPGQLNYAISKLVHMSIGDNLTYGALNTIMGVLESSKLEFYRTVVAPYEDKKRLENGNISGLDQ